MVDLSYLVFKNQIANFDLIFFVGQEASKVLLNYDAGLVFPVVSDFFNPHNHSLPFSPSLDQHDRF